MKFTCRLAPRSPRCNRPTLVRGLSCRRESTIIIFQLRREPMLWKRGYISCQEIKLICIPSVWQVPAQECRYIPRTAVASGSPNGVEGAVEASGSTPQKCNTGPHKYKNLSRKPVASWHVCNSKQRGLMSIFRQRPPCNSKTSAESTR